MKAENLQILWENGINVPEFIVLDKDGKPDMTFSNSEEFAVRSSFDGEDGENFSYAGQFDTLLNVSRDKVEEAINQVRKSIGKNNINDYAVAHNLSHSDNMKVIVQEMVNADYAGVMFTANPLGLLNEIVIVAGSGLGNNVVEDKTDITTYYYNKEDEIYYFDKQENSPVLDESIIKELIRISAKVEGIFGKPMDVEYAVKGDVVYILQARPITALHVSDTPVILDNSNIVESYPDISLPLTQSFVKEIYYKIFRSLVLRLTKDSNLIFDMDYILKDMTDIANGRIYYRISNWYDILHLLPFSKKIIKIWQSMLGVNNKNVTFNIEHIGFKTKFKVLCSFFSLLIHSPKEMDKLNSYFTGQMPVYRHLIEEKNDIDSLLELYENIKEDLASKWDITLANDMYSFIFTALAGKNNREIAHIKNLESMKPVLELQNICSIVKEYGFDSQEYRTAKINYIDCYGDRCLNELKLETKTYRTNPELFDDYINSQLYSEMTNPETPYIKTKNLFVKKAKLGILNREISRMNRSRIFGIMREIILKISGMMVEKGRLEDIWDIFYLYLDELKDDCDYKELVLARKAEYRNYEALPAFSRLVYNDRIFNKTLYNVESNNVGNAGSLMGIPASNGIVKGEIMLIEEASQDIDTTDKIIVTKTTDPGWVLLIKNCLGIIAEKGSILSHTAIITRELKKPSVVNVRNAMSVLHNGDTVELNADKGIIHILRRNNAGDM